MSHLLYDHPHCYKKVDAGHNRDPQYQHSFSTYFFRERWGSIANHINRGPRMDIRRVAWIGRRNEIGTVGRRQWFACESVRDVSARCVAVFGTESLYGIPDRVR